LAFVGLRTERRQTKALNPTVGSVDHRCEETPHAYRIALSGQTPEARGYVPADSVLFFPLLIREPQLEAVLDLEKRHPSRHFEASVSAGDEVGFLVVKFVAQRTDDLLEGILWSCEAS
jgi:hypothetical protein